MRILFVHQNFPGQFLHLAPALAARGHEVLALTAEGNQRPSPVRVVRYRLPEVRPVEGIARTYAEMAERGAAAARAADQLTLKHGFTPDLVFGHGGWGETLFLREIWPQARHLTYAEFLYAAHGLDTDFDPEFRRLGLAARLGTAARKAHLVQAVVDADGAVSPTEWQASTFPADLRGKISVIHDGIDTDRVAPDPEARLVLPNGKVLRPGDEVVSYVSRNLEPYRGWHIFVRALPEVLRARPGAQVVVVGDDGQSYGPRRGDGRSWKEALLDEVAGQLDLTRVHFLGRVPYGHFLSLMQVTRVHAYLTYPFVLSWSMLEAMAAGALVVGSRTPPVEEVLRAGENGRLVAFFDVEGWSRALVAALAGTDDADALRAAARRTIVGRYDLRRQCLPALVRFVEG
ncbi:MAG: glycosyltransferase [Paracoccaceae bacterium]